MSSPKRDRTKVFISYSHQDAKWLERLRVHLKPLERDDAVAIWDDTKIQPGSKWQEEIKQAIESAKVAVLLISADFLASDFITKNELPPLLQAACNEDAIVIPVLISSCRFTHTPSLSQFQSVNPPSKPLIDMTAGEQETLFLKVTEAIQTALNSVPQSKQPELISESVFREKEEDAPFHLLFSKKSTKDKKSNRKFLLQPENRIFVKLQKQQNRYSCIITDTLGTISIPEMPIALSGDIQFEDGISLGEVIERFKTGKVHEMDTFFTIRRQLSIGSYLYGQLFAEWLDRQPGQRTEVCIITDDEYLSQLPWILLADRGIFLASAGWTIYQAPFLPKNFITFHPYPLILVILPQPNDCSPTQGKEHFIELKELLQTIAPDLVSDFYLREVRTWNDLRQSINRNPQIIYYYGHGEYKNNTSRLIFENENHETDSIPILEFTKLFQQLEKPPQITYLNCCSGDTAGWIGAGNQLSEMVPVVIANRTTAYIDSSRQIAISFFNDVLRDGVSPVKAINRAVSNLPPETIRCFTPVCYATYQKWEGIPTKTKEQVYRDADWLITVDRGEQCERLVYRTKVMIINRKPHSLGFFWYGERGEGIEIFHKRFRRELCKHLNDIALWDRTIEWPVFVEDISKSLEELYCNLFEISDLKDIRTSIGRFHPYISGRTRIALIDHRPIEIGKTNQINSGILHDYLNWWANRLVHCFPKDIYVLLGMSFIVPNDMLEEFSGSIEETLHAAATDDFMTFFLARLNKLKESDIIDFIRTHEIPISQDKLRLVAQNLLENSGGHYDKTLELLKDIEKNWFQYIGKDRKNKSKLW